jgi:hypothetical protein
MPPRVRGGGGWPSPVAMTSSLESRIEYTVRFSSRREVGQRLFDDCRSHARFQRQKAYREGYPKTASDLETRPR